MKLNKTLTTFASLVVAGGLALSAHSKTFRVAMGDGGGGSQEYGAIKLNEKFSELTNGKYKLKLFGSSQLGSEQETVNDVAAGTLDFSILAANNLSPFAPKLGVVSLPYIFTSLDQAETITQGPIGKEIIQSVLEDANVRIVAWTYAGFRRFTNSKKPVTKPSDLKGLVVRVPKNKIMIETYKAWGINPTPMAWSEVPTALQQAVVDGQDLSYSGIYSMKFHEYQKHLTEINYLLLMEPIIMSESAYKKLSASEKDALAKAGDYASKESAAYLRKNEARIKGILGKHLKIAMPANNEKEWINLAVSKVWPQFYEEVGGKSFVNKVLKAVGRDPVK